ncbi:glutamate racemase [Faecalispora anaeroviscerum]|uniref:glutamate racemase n=1 Tax=Faecalispora anaeroviscerum TaxID=2991836 RepID=UPI0024BB30EC|nr:glutamate racemase [Faecalispora anaeroviscerum]
MSNLKGSIGVMDSGIGGLTVAKEIQRILPHEDILYFGDSANCPYGNRTAEEITELSRKMLRFLGDREVKVVAIACNTISTLVDVLTPGFDFKIIGIVDPSAAYVVHSGIKRVGLIATEFTVASGNYDKLIHRLDPEVQVTGKGSPLLAGLVDRGDFNQHDINTEIRTQIDNILSRDPQVQHVILGCTHYPIIEKNFKECYPELSFINPALEQANVVRDYLTEKDSLAQEGEGSFTICTSGDPEVYVQVAKRIGMKEPTSTAHIAL